MKALVSSAGYGRGDFGLFWTAEAGSVQLKRGSNLSDASPRVRRNLSASSQWAFELALYSLRTGLEVRETITAWGDGPLQLTSPRPGQRLAPSDVLPTLPTNLLGSIAQRSGFHGSGFHVCLSAGVDSGLLTYAISRGGPVLLVVAWARTGDAACVTLGDDGMVVELEEPFAESPEQLWCSISGWATGAPR